MKNKESFVQFALPLLLVLLVSFCLEPVQAVWMPTMFANMILVAVIVVFIVFAVFIWKEKASDERAELHRLVADRVAFLVGSGILVCGMLWQTWHHLENTWLLGALVGMVLAKLAVLVYQELHR